MKTINLLTIRIDGGTQSRVELNNAALAEYVDALKGGADFPPVVVFFDGTDNWLADGFHRYHAYRTAGLASIPADVRSGTTRDALLFSLGANAGHGLRRTNDDKRKAVTVALTDGEWGKWSDNAIAKLCGVSQNFVSEMHRSLKSDLSDGFDTPRTFTTKHGTQAVMKTAAIGKKPEATEPETAPAEPAPQPAQDDGAPDEAELQSVAAAETAQQETMALLLATDAPLAAAAEENTRLRLQVVQLSARIVGLQNKELELVRMLKSRDRVIAKLEKEKAAA